jgi:hypothetical protein
MKLKPFLLQHIPLKAKSEKGGSSFTPLKIIWGKDLGLTISHELWAEVCDRVYCSSTNVKNERI